MTPFASVAMLEKLALLKIALCRAPVFSRDSACRTSILASAASGVVSGAISMCSSVLAVAVKTSGGLVLHGDRDVHDGRRGLESDGRWASGQRLVGSHGTALPNFHLYLIRYGFGIHGVGDSE